MRFILLILTLILSTALPADAIDDMMLEHETEIRTLVDMEIDTLLAEHESNIRALVEQEKDNVRIDLDAAEDALITETEKAILQITQGPIFGSGRRRSTDGTGDSGEEGSGGGDGGNGGGNGGGGGGEVGDPPDAEFVTQWENDPVDTQLETFADIDDLMNQNPSFNQFLLQHDGAGSAILNTKVDSDRWLHFHYEPQDGDLARIEAKIEQNVGHAEVVKETRSTAWVHLNSELDILKGAGLGGRLMMFSEFKVRPSSSDSFRIILRFIADDTHGLTWLAEARTAASDPENIIYWQHRNRDVGVPIGQDFELEVYYKAGNAQTGRLVVTIDRNDGAGPITIFDITDWTDLPNASEIRGVQNWYPFLLYVANNTTAAQHLADNDVAIDYAVKWWAVDTGN